MNNSCSISKPSTYSPTQTKRQFCPWKFFKTPPNLLFISSRLKSSNKSISPKITFPALKKGTKNHVFLQSLSPTHTAFHPQLPPAPPPALPRFRSDLPIPVLTTSRYSLSLSLSLSEIWNPKISHFLVFKPRWSDSNSTHCNMKTWQKFSWVFCSKGISDFASLDLLCVLFFPFLVITYNRQPH